MQYNVYAALARLVTYTVILREYVHASAGYWSYSGTQGYKLQPPCHSHLNSIIANFITLPNELLRENNPDKLAKTQNVIFLNIFAKLFAKPPQKKHAILAVREKSSKIPQKTVDPHPSSYLKV